MSEEVSGRKLAKILGFAPSYIAKLKDLGILKNCLVVVAGKKHPLFDVEKAVSEIEASKDPAKEHVRERWEQHRSDKPDTTADKTSKANQSGRGHISDGVDSGVGTQDKENIISFHDAKTKKEIFLAKKAELDFEKAAGHLVDKGQVQKSAIECAQLVREGLSTIPDRLSQVLAAETGPERIHEYLNEEFKKMLNVLSDRIERDTGARITGT